MIKIETEEKLLILLSQVHMQECNMKDVLTILQKTVNWEKFLLLVYSNNVDMIVYYNIIKFKLELYIHANVLDMLRKIFEEKNKRFQRLRKEFDDLVQSLNAEHVDYVVLKGFSLVDNLYTVEQNLYIRNFNDIDILVMQSELLKIKQIMKRHNFRQAKIREGGSIEDYSREEKLYYRMATHQIAPYIKIGKDNYVFEVDVNFSAFWGGTVKDCISTEDLLEDKKKVTSEDNNVYYCLPNEKALIHLLFHVYKDIDYHARHIKLVGVTLQKIMDIREFIIQKYELIDINLFCNLVKEASIEEQIAKILAITFEVYGDKYIAELIYKLIPDFKFYRREGGICERKFGENS